MEQKTRWFRYCTEDAKAAQAELDQLADQGWELVELGIFTALFRRSDDPRRCWVEPARWRGDGKKDTTARDAYLALCQEAGWTLLDEAGGLFYFQAQPGEHPAPIQTDEGVEWEDVWKKALSAQIWSFFALGIYWVIYTSFHFILDKPRIWELFFSNGLMVTQLLLILWLVLDLVLGLRVICYRKNCRQAAREGAPMPVPRRNGARFRGALPLWYTILGAGVAIGLLLGITNSWTAFEGSGSLNVEGSVLGQAVEYREFSPQGNVWVESYDCKTGWLAGLICDDLRSGEGDEDRLDREFHMHAPAELIPAELGYDQAWTYRWTEGSGLLFRQGNRVVRVEAEKLDLTDHAEVAALLAELEEAACALP